MNVKFSLCGFKASPFSWTLRRRGISTLEGSSTDGTGSEKARSTFFLVIRPSKGWDAQRLAQPPIGLLSDDPRAERTGKRNWKIEEIKDHSWDSGI
jgi:hypothetical protein